MTPIRNGTPSKDGEHNGGSRAMLAEHASFMVASVASPSIVLELLQHVADASNDGLITGLISNAEGDDCRNHEMYSSAANSPTRDAKGKAELTPGVNVSESISVPVYGLGNVTVDGLTTGHPPSPRLGTTSSSYLPRH